MQVPPWHMRRHGPDFVPDRKVLTPPVCFTGRLLLEQYNPWEGGLERGHSWQGVFGQHTALVARVLSLLQEGQAAPAPERQWAAQVTVEGSSGCCGQHTTQAARHRAAGTGGTGSIQPGQMLVRGWMDEKDETAQGQELH